MIDEISIISENLMLKGALSVTKSKLEASQKQCKFLEEQLKQQTNDYYAMIDAQEIEITWLREALKKYKREDGQV